MCIGFPGGAVVKNPPANARDARDTDSIPASGRSSGIANGNLLQYSRLKNSKDRGASGAPLWGCKKLNTTEKLSTHAHAYTHAYTFKKLRSWHLVPPLHGK